MIKYTMVFTYVFVICMYQTVTADGKPTVEKQTAAANKPQSTVTKSAATAAKTPTAGKPEESDEEYEDYSDEPPKKDSKPSTGVQNPAQTAAANNAAKPAAVTQTQAKQNKEESEEYSEEQPKKDSKVTATGTPKPAQDTTIIKEIESNPKSPAGQTKVEKPENNSDEPPKKDTKTTTSNKKSYKEIKDASDDRSYHVYYRGHHKTQGASKIDKHGTPIVYYTDDSEPNVDEKKEYRHLLLYGLQSHSISHTPDSRIFSRRKKPISINIPIQIY